MADWYRTHNASPDAYPDSEYTEWAQDNGLYVDAAGNVDYGPPEFDPYAGNAGLCAPGLCSCGRDYCEGNDVYPD